MKSDILKCLGNFPKKTNLNIVQISNIEYKEYNEILIEYNVEIKERVRSYLLVPKKEGIKPAIVAIHQHASDWSIGKSEVIGKTNNEMFSYGLDLVKRGYVVIAPDLLCFESRQGSEKFKKNKEMQRLYERFEFCKYILNGSCLQTKYLHDLSVAIDVLCSLEYVDKNNIGAIGHSLGGQESIWLSWFDERIKCCISSCGISCIKDIEDYEVVQNFAFYVPNLNNICDIDEIINEIAPRAILLTNGLKDERHCPLSGIDRIEEKNKNNINFKLIKFDDDHKFNNSEKIIAYNFLDRYLK